MMLFVFCRDILVDTNSIVKFLIHENVELATLAKDMLPIM